jgi:hypothetical protein
MKDTTTIAQITIRILGTIMIVLGVLIWTGNFDSLIALHRLFGFVLVIALWTLAYLAYTSGANQRLAIVAFLWGLLAPILGLTQENILTGNGHWVIQILHLLIGLGIIGLGERLAMLIEARRGAPAGRAA